jgi:hypothetical protein
LQTDLEIDKDVIHINIKEIKVFKAECKFDELDKSRQWNSIFSCKKK